MGVHAFDHNAFDYVAFDVDQVPLGFGGAPQEFFSYSGERLAWSEKPFVVKKKPVEVPEPITGQLATFQSSGRHQAVGKITLLATIQTKQRSQRLVGVGLYTPLAIKGSGRTQQRNRMRSDGDMFDIELVEELLALL